MRIFGIVRDCIIKLCRSCILLYTTRFYVGRDIETCSRQFRTSYRCWHRYVYHSSIQWTWYVAVWINVQTGMRWPTTSTCNPSKLSMYLMYYDVNNLYDWAMCQLLPYTDFCWIDNIDNFDVTLDSLTGYVLEVDLKYPQHVHDAHFDLPFRPTREKPSGKWEALRKIVYIKSVTLYITQSAAMYSSRLRKDPLYIAIRAISMVHEYIEFNKL